MTGPDTKSTFLQGLIPFIRLQCINRYHRQALTCRPGFSRFRPSSEVCPVSRLPLHHTSWGVGANCTWLFKQLTTNYRCIQDHNENIWGTYTFEKRLDPSGCRNQLRCGAWCQVMAMPKAAQVGNIPEETMSRVQLLEIRTDVRRFDECGQTCINNWQYLLISINMQDGEDMSRWFKMLFRTMEYIEDVMWVFEWHHT